MSSVDSGAPVWFINIEDDKPTTAVPHDDNKIIDLTVETQHKFVDLRDDDDDDEDDDDGLLIDLTQDEEDDIDQEDEDDEDEEEDENDDLEIIEEFIENLTQEEHDDAIARTEDRASSDSSSKALPALTGGAGNRNPRFNLAVINSYMMGEWELLPGMFVELLADESLGQSTGDFILIDTILKDLASEEVFLRGTRFRRTHCLKGMLEKKLNEVYMVQRHNQQNHRTIEEQSLEEVPAQLVVCVRMLVKTNQPYPRSSWRVWNPMNVRLSSQTKTSGNLSGKDRAAVKERAQLVCRFKYTIAYSNPANQRTGRIEEQRIERISQTESDAGFAMSDRVLREMSRAPDNDTIIDLTKDKAVQSYRERIHEHGIKQGYVQAGEARDHVINISDDNDIVEIADENVIEILDDTAPEDTHTSTEKVTKESSTGPRRSTIPVRTPKRLPVALSRSPSKNEPSMSVDGLMIRGQLPSTPSRRTQRSRRPSAEMSKPVRYTFGDGFCGAGGISRGATEADLDIKWAFDMWPQACRTYRRNFRDVRIFKKRAFDFITRWRDTRSVDILHLSPPCQKFSPAHTVQGKDDDDNEASLFAVGCVTQKAKPRIVTIEETSGIKTHHPIFLHALILQLTRLGFSVSWKIMNFAEYGLAQPRKRLIIIASCPGEPLPPFPERTRGPGLRSFATIREALSQIRDGMPNQDYSRTVPRNESSYSFDTQLKSCITCSGGQGNLFCDGQRTFTERELACLQGFPTEHRFWGKRGEVKKQIGNAVPPLFARQLYETIIKTLRARDAAEAAREKDLPGFGSSRSSRPRPSSSRSTGSGADDVIMID